MSPLYNVKNLLRKNQKKRDIKMVMRDLSAKVGCENDELKSVMASIAFEFSIIMVKGIWIFAMLIN
jgi:hypothetical protein